MVHGALAWSKMAGGSKLKDSNTIVFIWGDSSSTGTRTTNKLVSDESHECSGMELWMGVGLLTSITTLPAGMSSGPFWPFYNVSI